LLFENALGMLIVVRGQGSGNSELRQWRSERKAVLRASWFRPTDLGIYVGVKADGWERRDAASKNVVVHKDEFIAFVRVEEDETNGKSGISNK
jgi:hypothetical protein